MLMVRITVDLIGNFHINRCMVYGVCEGAYGDKGFFTLINKVDHCRVLAEEYGLFTMVYSIGLRYIWIKNSVLVQ